MFKNCTLSKKISLEHRSITAFHGFSKQHFLPLLWISKQNFLPLPWISKETKFITPLLDFQATFLTPPLDFQATFLTSPLDFQATFRTPPMDFQATFLTRPLDFQGRFLPPSPGLSRIISYRLPWTFQLFFPPWVDNKCNLPFSFYDTSRQQRFAFLVTIFVSFGADFGTSLRCFLHLTVNGSLVL